MKKFSLLCIISMVLLGTTCSAFTAPKTIKFASDATYPPFVSLSPSLQFEGFEVKLIQALCHEAHLNCTFSHLPFDSLFLSLSLKKIDAVFGGIAITEDRKKQVLFSDPLYTSAIGFIFPSSKPITLNKASLQGKTIAVQQGSTFEYYLKAKYSTIADIKTYVSIQDALLDLSTTRIDTVFGDIPVLIHWIKTKNQPNYQTLELEKQASEAFSQGNAIAVRKEDEELIKILNATLEKIKTNGIYEKLKDEYLE